MVLRDIQAVRVKLDMVAVRDDLTAADRYHSDNFVKGMKAFATQDRRETAGADGTAPTKFEEGHMKDKWVDSKCR